MLQMRFECKLKACESNLAKIVTENGEKTRALEAIYKWLISVEKLDPSVEGLDAVILLANAALASRTEEKK